MAPLPIEDVSSPQTPSPHPNPEPTAPHDMHYYLTEGLGGVEPRQFRDAKSFIRIIESQAGKLCSGKASQQYAVFAPMTQDQFATIDRIRRARLKGHRFHYFNHEETLIVKIMAGPVQEMTSKGFRSRGRLRVETSEVSPPWNRLANACHRMWGFSIPRSLGGRCSLVVRELRRTGEIVLLISYSASKKEIRLQQWELVTIPDPHVTHGQPRPTRTAPAIMREIDLVAGVSNEASLMLNFESVFLRPPASGEGDFTFSRKELERFSTNVWKGSQ
ncbi:hypothetical protein B9Z19DRAFT_510851 [Tuber borchii]|uniref:Uncharacterized protein n=1 Tax=Tuber borchii TaxID=42251 RepID=A0A2T6ZE42_TUBBO|nr:hypothetical protein B9Z19DRAFT_510851 [Tuber borchii]